MGIDADSTFNSYVLMDHIPHNDKANSDTDHRYTSTSQRQCREEMVVRGDISTFLSVSVQSHSRTWTA